MYTHRNSAAKYRKLYRLKRSDIKKPRGNCSPLKTKIATKRREIRFGVFTFLQEMEQFQTLYAKCGMHCLFYLVWNPNDNEAETPHSVLCVCVSQQMLPTVRKTVATVRSNEQCFVIICVKTMHKDQAVSSFVRMTNQLWFTLFCTPLTER